MLRAAILTALSVGILAGVFGCSGGASGPALVNIEGKIAADGKTVEMGNVVLHPENLQQSACSGNVSAGVYTVSAPTGKYKVTVETPDGGPQPFDAKYSDPQKTPLTIQVVRGAAAGAYDLNLNK